MQVPQQRVSKAEYYSNTVKAVPSTRNLQHSSEEGKRVPFKLKSCSPLDGTSNLEFTNPGGKSCFPTSLINIGQNQQSYTLPKIHHNTTSLQKNQIKRMNPPEAFQRSHGILKEISSADDEIFLYKIWPGNNQFYFDGRLMTGPKTDKLPNLAAWGLFLGLSGVYFGAALPSGEFATLTNLLAIYLFLSTIIFFLFTSFTDPGIIPRKRVWELNGEVPKPYCAVQKNETSNNLSQEKPAQNSEKFCTICHIKQTARMIHCKDCGNCVEESKGHLRIFNNCVGKRNYQFFVGLITSMVLMILLYMISFIIFMIQSFLYDLKSSNGAGAGIDNDTIDTVIGYLIGIPTAIFLFIKLSLFLIRARRNENQEEREDKQGIISFKDRTADLRFTDPSKINPRQLIRRAKLQKYKMSLLEGQNQV